MDKQVSFLGLNRQKCFMNGSLSHENGINMDLPDIKTTAIDNMAEG